MKGVVHVILRIHAQVRSNLICGKEASWPMLLVQDLIIISQPHQSWLSSSFLRSHHLACDKELLPPRTCFLLHLVRCENIIPVFLYTDQPTLKDNASLRWGITHYLLRGFALSAAFQFLRFE